MKNRERDREFDVNVKFIKSNDSQTLLKKIGKKENKANMGE